MTDKFKYEVAFSFLTRDEPLAQKLNDLLHDRFATFIYPERQLDLAGKDGEIILKRAFGSETRIVVILYRKEWGTTPWTRIEQDAIRERGYHDGYDFCLLVPLESPSSKPEWFPPHRLWIGLERWGIDSAAAVIEARVNDAGGVTRIETLTERKARLEREVLAAEKRKRFLESENAVQPAEAEARHVLTEINRFATTLSTNEFPLKAEPDDGGVKITSYGFILQAYWRLSYANSLVRSGLYLRLLQLDRDYRFNRKFDELTKLEFHFSVNEAEQYGWQATWGDKQFSASNQLVEFALRLILDKVTEFRRRQANDINDAVYDV